MIGGMFGGGKKEEKIEKSEEEKNKEIKITDTLFGKLRN